MHGKPPHDGDGRPVDWSRASKDYARHRPGFPPDFYERLLRLGIGKKEQRVLDLGTGTGTVALELARRGCRVVGVDVAEGQVAEARRRAEEGGLAAEFLCRRAEETGLVDDSFDVVTAAQCWPYFDRDRVVPEIKRVLAPGGRLVTCHMSWPPRQDAIARGTEKLVLRHNPRWSTADWDGRVPRCPEWIRQDFEVAAFFVYDAPIPFTRVSWRGRIRACRGIGATLSAAEVEAFDREHQRLLEETVPEEFTVIHRIDAHILAPR